MTFACFAVLLSAVWSAFASLILYVRHVSITADSTYVCLLIVCAMLAIAAQARLMLASPGRGRRVARQPGRVDPFEAEANEAESPAASGTGFYAIAAIVAGVSLFASGLYASITILIRLRWATPGSPGRRPSRPTAMSP